MHLILIPTKYHFKENTIKTNESDQFVLCNIYMYVSVPVNTWMTFPEVYLESAVRRSASPLVSLSCPTRLPSCRWLGPGLSHSACRNVYGLCRLCPAPVVTLGWNQPVSRPWLWTSVVLWWRTLCPWPLSWWSMRVKGWEREAGACGCSSGQVRWLHRLLCFDWQRSPGKEIELNAEADYGRFLTECGFLKARQYSLMLRLQDL